MKKEPARVRRRPSADPGGAEHRQNEEELLRHALVYRSMQEAVLIFGPGGLIMDVNPATEKVLGWSREELLGKSAGILNPPEQVEEITAGILQGLEKKGLWQGEIPIITKSGEHRTMSAIISCLRDRDGNWIGNIGINRDITDQKRMEEALARQGEHYRTLFEISPLAIMLADADGRVVAANNAFCDYLGYPRKEMLGLEINRFAVSDSQELIKSNIRRILAGKALRHIVKNQRKDGTDCYLDLNEKKVILPDGKPGVLMAALDITEQIQAVAELKESEVKFQQLFSGMSNCVAVYEAVEEGEDFIIKDFNRAAEELEKLKKESIIGRRVTEVFPRIVEFGLLGVLRRVWKTGKAEHYPVSFYEDRRIAGWRENYIYKLPSGDVVAVYNDVTVRKRMEEELGKTQKLESLGILAGGIAHDFNNILMSIMGNVSIAKLKAKEDNDISRLLAEAESACIQAKNLTQQLLTFSRGGKPVKRTIFISDLIRDSTRLALSGSKSEATFSIADSLWPVEADPPQIQQVLNNLIINAGQAMPGGGQVKIGARNITITKKMGLPLKDGRYIQMTCTDTGVGIPEKFLGRVFDPYFTTKKQGSGLGLATAYSIIKNHGGLITVESKAENGTTFTVYLPASEKEVRRERRFEKQISGGEGKILLMDDNPAVRTVAMRMVQELGYEVVGAGDGTEAIVKFREARQEGHPFDAVILDLTIKGGLGGQEALRELKKIDPELKAIVSSGYSTNAAMADYKKFGFRGIIAKPYKLEELSRTLDQVIRESSSESKQN